MDDNVDINRISELSMVVRDARIVGFSGFGAFELFTMRLHGTLAGHPPCLLDRLHIVG